MKKIKISAIILMLLALVAVFSTPVRAMAYELPSWHPDAGADLVKHHDKNTPRVIDIAELFSPSEEAQMLDKIRTFSAQTGKDLVIYTDVSTYGYDIDGFTADFYDYNGYGLGDEYEGICLMLDLDPYSRQFHTLTTGEDTRSLYTVGNAERLNAVLNEYLVKGDYAGGILNWIDNITLLYTEGKLPPKPVNPLHVGLAALLAILVGVFAGSASDKRIMAKMQTAKEKTDAADYVDEDNTTVNATADYFLFRKGTRVRSFKRDFSYRKSYESSSGRKHS